jgi:hypothetical protein
LIDIIEDSEGAELVEAGTALTALYTGFRQDAEKGDSGGLRGERVVNIVADVEGFAWVATFENFYQAFGGGLGIGDVFDGDDGFEVAADVVVFKGVIQFVPVAPGENAELGFSREARKSGIAQEPFFFAHVPLAILAPVEFLELLFYFVEGDVCAQVVYPGGGKFPIVVEAGAIFPGVEFAQGDAFFGEKFHGLQGGKLEGVTRIHEHAIYIENYDGGVGLRELAARRSSGFATARGIRNGSRSILRKSRWSRSYQMCR